MGRGSLKKSGERIEIIDILRGFALAGILYAHMVFWYTGASLPQEVYFKYDDFFSEVAMAIFGALVFGKFFSVFSFLFGLGFYLHFRKDRSEGPYFKTYIWRMFLLFLIGLLHHTFWRGDILAIYAVLGVVLLFLRHLPGKLLLWISLLLIINLPTHAFEFFNAPDTNIGIDFPMAAEALKYYSLVKDGDLTAVLRENTGSWQAKIEYQLESGRLLMTLGYFLLGFYAGRKKFFSNIEKNLSHFKKLNDITAKAVLILLLIGLILYLFDYVTLPELTIDPQLQWVLSFLFSIYNASLTFFYITGITLLFRRENFHIFLKPLGKMGRMPLTNYLMQTLFGLLIFYQFGLGLFDKTSPALNVPIMMIVFYLQLKFSQFWLNHYNQGPVEWLWKSFTNLNISILNHSRKSRF